MTSHATPLAVALAALMACSTGGTASSSDAGAQANPPTAAPAGPEKRCGEAPQALRYISSPADVSKLSDCTVLVGHFQEDSVTGLEDFSGLEKVRKIEGMLNVFRSPGFTSLRGLENLETIEGNLSIHLNTNLASLAALAKLRYVSGSLYIARNGALPQAEVEALAARLVVGGTKTLK